MRLASDISPTIISSAERLREYFALVRILSEQTSPHELLMAYRSRSRFVVPYDVVISMSRRGLSDGRVRLTRSNLWEQDIDPWKSPERLPIVEGGLIPQLMDGGRPVKIDQLEVAPDDPLAPYAEGMNSLVASPLFHQGLPLYMVILMRAEPASFTLDELSTLVLTSNLVGRATSQTLMTRQLTEAYDALDREFRAVGEIQRALLPSELPTIEGVSIAVHYETSARAGGDYYDFFPLPDGRLGMLIADVSGHGPAAAVVMAMMHAILHARPELACHPLRVMQVLNHRLLNSVKSGQFATAFYGVLDPKALTLCYTLAGHDPPRLLRGNHELSSLPLTEGMPLAIQEELELSEQTVHLKKKDRLLLFTDGITESFGPKGDMFGVARLDGALRRCRATPNGMISCITSDLISHSGEGIPTDDRTLVAIALD
jgi:sigma-B regulation protein RsbU (phosphoserine phosphatase)